MTNVIGMSRSDYVPGNATLEVTWGSPIFGIGALFSSYFSDVFNRVPPSAALFPIAASGVVPGDRTAIVPFRNNRARSASDIVASLEALDNNFVEVQSVRLLTAEQKTQSNTAAGAADRNSAVTDANKKAADDSPLGKLKSLFDQLGTAAKWAAVVTIVVVLGLVVAKFKK